MLIYQCFQPLYIIVVLLIKTYRVLEKTFKDKNGNQQYLQYAYKINLKIY